MANEEKVPLVGVDGKVHMIPADHADDYRHGSTGAALTDEQWDEQKRRKEANHDHLVPERFRVKP